MGIYCNKYNMIIMFLFDMAILCLVIGWLL